MRYSLEHKAQNHENILSVAARSFREHGGDSSGIGTVMKKVGLTKGGFLPAFKSKDDLFVEAWHGHSTRWKEGCWKLQGPRPKVSSAGYHRTLSQHGPREFARNGLCGLRARARARAASLIRAKDGLRRREKRIGSGYCPLFLVRREKKKWRSFSCCSPHGWGADCGPDDRVPSNA